MAANETAAQLNKIKRLIKEAGGRIRHMDLLRKMPEARTKDLAERIDVLKQMGFLEVEIVDNEGAGRRPTFYRMVKPSV